MISANANIKSEVILLATTGSVDVNLDNIKDIINESTNLGALTIGGVADQGDLIGLGIGIALALTLLFGAIFVAIGVVPRLIKSVKGFKK